jgi:hypothetical protein
VSDAPPTPASRRGWLTPRRLAVILGVWVLAVGGALLLANALDDPVGEGARDEAQAVSPGPVAVPGVGGSGQRLPPLALVLDRRLPDGLSDMPPIRQAEELSRRVRSDPDPRRLVELGSVLQLLGNPEGAGTTYRQALEGDPGNLAAQTGLAMVAGASGGGGLTRAAADLAALAREHPGSQLVAFNQGWVEIYRRRAAPAEAAWKRAIALGPETRLGQTAAALLEQLEKGAGSG